jgi:hypothetical protein
VFGDEDRGKEIQTRDRRYGWMYLGKASYTSVKEFESTRSQVEILNAEPRNKLDVTKFSEVNNECENPTRQNAVPDQSGIVPMLCS